MNTKSEFSLSDKNQYLGGFTGGEEFDSRRSTPRIIKVGMHLYFVGSTSQSYPPLYHATNFNFQVLTSIIGNLFRGEKVMVTGAKID